MGVTPATIITGAINDPTGAGIARTIGSLVADGDLIPGTQLPTVRALARELDVSPSTVSEAWRILRENGVIETDRRRGTTVRDSSRTHAGRYWHVPVQPGTLGLDLSTGTPDPTLLPPLGPTLGRVHLDLAVSSYLDEPVIPELAEALRGLWPFPPEALTVVDGAQDALDRLIDTLVDFGDRVVVEDPTFPPLLDLLDIAGATVIGVPIDDEGMTVDGLSAALAHQPTALFLQPRAHNPAGVGLSRRRSEQLASVMADSPVIVVEDDHSGDVSGAHLHSIGVHRPNRTVHIRSFSKSHGPDLRLAAMGGAAAPIDALVRRRQLGPSWTSRLLQRVLLDLLSDTDVAALVADAERTYAARRMELLGELDQRGVHVAAGGSGLNLWVPVDNDRDAVVSLAALGIGVAPGEPFEVEPADQRHIRVTLSMATGVSLEEIADAIADAATTRSGTSAR